jgi:hypothetical protein
MTVCVSFQGLSSVNVCEFEGPHDFSTLGFFDENRGEVKIFLEGKMRGAAHAMKAAFDAHVASITAEDVTPEAAQ